MQNTTHAKLAAIDEKLKRWQSRLTRAHNAIVKFNRQRKRITNPKLMAAYDDYMAKQNAAALEVVKAQSAKLEAGLERELKKGFEQAKKTKRSDDISWSEMTGADLAIPADLNRADPLIAEKMTKARKEAEAEARKAMPLSGRAAMLHVLKKDGKKEKARRGKA